MMNRRKRSEKRKRKKWRKGKIHSLKSFPHKLFNFQVGASVFAFLGRLVYLSVCLSFSQKELDMINKEKLHKHLKTKGIG